MTGRNPPGGPYREQLAELARALAAGAADALGAALAEGSTPAHVRLFTDGNLTKRHEALRAYLEFLAGAFDDFDGRLGAYLRERPRPPSTPPGTTRRGSWTGPSGPAA